MREKEITCPLCNSNSSTKLHAKANYNRDELDSYAFASRKIPEYMHHEIIECATCRLLFCVDIPDSATLHSLYKEAEYDSPDEAKNASATYMKYLRKFADSPQPESKALDIGTGEGSFLKYLLAFGYKNVMGIEPSEAPIAHADSEIRPFIINDIFSVDKFDEQSFDLISLFQTIEHIPDSGELLKNIRRLLKPEGVLYVVCHDYLSFVNRVLGVKSPIYDIEHLQLFSKDSIRKLLFSAGFSNIQTFKIRNSYPLSYWVKLFPMNKKLKQHLLKILDKSKLGRINLAVNVGNIGVIAIKGESG